MVSLGVRECPWTYESIVTRWSSAGGEESLSRKRGDHKPRAARRAMVTCSIRCDYSSAAWDMIVNILGKIT